MTPSPTSIAYYRVADFPFAVCLPEGADAAALLPSAEPFRLGEAPAEPLLFRLAVDAGPLPAASPAARLLASDDNDMGHVRLLHTPGDGYRIDTSFGPAARRPATHSLLFQPPYAEARASVCFSSPAAGPALNSLLRILFAQAIVAQGGLSVHAACVHTGGLAYLFLGKSGTGKSTHAALWRRHIEDCHLLNDDNPTLRLDADGSVWAYGTPWSGKTPCYVNLALPVKGIARLSQAPCNRLSLLSDTDAFAALLPSCSGLKQDAALMDSLYNNLVGVAERVRVAHLECRPDREAALLCHAALSR